MNAEQREIARLNARIKELEAELAEERKAGDTFWDVLLGVPANPPKSDLGKALDDASNRVGPAVPRTEVRRG